MWVDMIDIPYGQLSPQVGVNVIFPVRQSQGTEVRSLVVHMSDPHQDPESLCAACLAYRDEVLTQ